jgi:hypothetical protein
LHNLLANGFALVKDPGASGTISFDPKGFAICQVVTAGAETRTLESATNHAIGTELWVIGQTIVTSLAINGASNGSPVLVNGGDVAVFVVSVSGSTKIWLVKESTQGGSTFTGNTPETITNVTNTVLLTPAQVLTKIIHGTPTGAATYTFPSAADMLTAMPGARIGDAFDVTVSNLAVAPQTITVVAGTNGTTAFLNNTLTQFISKRFRFVWLTVGGSPTYNLYSYYS